MKWNTAIKQIEKAQAEGRQIQVAYHTKYAKVYHIEYDMVDYLVDYEWQGIQYKAINTYNNQLHSNSHTIDAIFIDSIIE